MEGKSTAEEEGIDEQRPAKLKVKITRWHGVAEWHWKVEDECCGICRMPFDSYCSNCKLPGDNCPPMWGKCKHAFHMHCILRWISSQTESQNCPMCRQPWEFRD
ncbi:ubiquitin-protein ligase Anaphase Promoting Complex [Balamuthia mandrillaris]